MTKNKIIVFSGGCFSGKTTTIERLWYMVPKSIILEENIRDYLSSTTIDEIRNNASQYFHLQIRIITAKIIKEWKYKLLSFKYDKILIDRSLGDSLFYYTFYVNRDGLGPFDRILYSIFYYLIFAAAYINFNYVYDKVFEFEPLNLTCTDTQFRPNKLDSQQEFNGIIYFNNKFIKSSIRFNLNNEDELEKIFIISGVNNEM